MRIRSKPDPPINRFGPESHQRRPTSNSGRLMCSEGWIFTRSDQRCKCLVRATLSVFRWNNRGPPSSDALTGELRQKHLSGAIALQPLDLCMAPD